MDANNVNFRRWSRYALVLVAALALGACGDDNGGGGGGANNGGADAGNNGGGDAGAQGPQATFQTYNVGLARGFVPEAEARLDPVAQALSDSPADVMCLQEVWLVQNDQDEWVTDQIDTIVNQTSETFPYNYYDITEGGAAVSCTAEEAAPLEQCVQANCADVPNDQLSSCALQNCSDELNAVSPDCQSCIIGQVGNPLDEIISTCTGGGASAFSYNGHNGLLMLSRYEFQNPESTSFDSALVQRSALHGVVSVPEFGDVDVYCTHLAANLSDVPYPSDGTYAGYEEEQAGQIDALMSWIDETATTDNIVVMGDMNTGPAKGDLQAEFPDNYQKFVDAGWADPYLAQQAPECTYCGSNTLNTGDEKLAIDHIFLDVSDGIEVADVMRVYDQTVAIEASTGTTEQMNLSDHYGVQVTLEEPVQQ